MHFTAAFPFSLCYTVSVILMRSLLSPLQCMVVHCTSLGFTKAHFLWLIRLVIPCRSQEIALWSICDDIVPTYMTHLLCRWETTLQLSAFLVFGQLAGRPSFVVTLFMIQTTFEQKKKPQVLSFSLEGTYWGSNSKICNLISKAWHLHGE